MGVPKKKICLRRPGEGSPKEGDRITEWYKLDGDAHIRLSTRVPRYHKKPQATPYFNVGNPDFRVKLEPR